MKKTRVLIASLFAGALALSGCAGGETKPADSAKGSETPATPAAETVDLTVFAAASLNKAFPEIAEQVLAKDHPEISVKFSFEGSSTLVDQLKSGAPADVFASADEKNMKKATDADLVTDVTPFAANVLTLIVPAGNPGGVTGLDKLDGKSLVVCAVGVPCGNATQQLAEQLGVTLHPVSEEQKVTDVRGKIENGQADAGLVYATDAKAAGDKVEVIDVPGAEKVVNLYPIAVVKESKHSEAARAFLDAVTGAAGQEILAGYGFRSPEK